jgi:hypothetical protein
MKKVLTAVLCLFIMAHLTGQVFNTATTLKKGKFAIGINPAYYNDNMALFLHGNAGIASGVDLALKYGFLDGSDYIGADLEWALLKSNPDISLTTGAHAINDFALDISVNISFPIKGGIALYTGADSDLRFDSNVDLLFWIPVGIEMKIKNKISFLLEGEIPVSDPAFPVIDGGVMFYF